MRTGIIYVLSAFVGTLVAALFIRNSPAVNSSAALFGLLGAMLSGLIRDWNVYTDKVLYLLFHWHHPSHLFSVNLANGCIDPSFAWFQLAAISFLSIVSTINFVVGLLPYANNFSSIGGLISGFLLGFILLFTPDDKPLVHKKAGLYEYNTKTYIKSKLKLDRPIMGVWLILFVVLWVLFQFGVKLFPAVGPYLFRLDIVRYAFICMQASWISCSSTYRNEYEPVLQLVQICWLHSF